MESKNKRTITVTIKKLEFLFVIVYFLTALLCFIVFNNLECLKGSVAGFLVAIGDWFLLKIMAKKWIKRGRYSLIDTALRFLIVGVSVYVLLSLNISSMGILLGISAIPLSLMIVAVLSLLFKEKIEV